MTIRNVGKDIASSIVFVLGVVIAVTGAEKGTPFVAAFGALTSLCAGVYEGLSARSRKGLC